MSRTATALLAGAASFLLNMIGVSVSSPTSLSLLNPLGEWVKSLLAQAPLVGGFIAGLETKWVVAGCFMIGLWIFASWLIHVLGDAKGLVIGVAIGVIILVIWSGMLWNFLPKPSALPSLPTNSTTITGG